MYMAQANYISRPHIPFLDYSTLKISLFQYTFSLFTVFGSLISEMPRK